MRHKQALVKTKALTHISTIIIVGISQVLLEESMVEVKKDSAKDKSYKNYPHTHYQS